MGIAGFWTAIANLQEAVATKAAGLLPPLVMTNLDEFKDKTVAVDLSSWLWTMFPFFDFRHKFGQQRDLFTDTHCTWLNRFTDRGIKLIFVADGEQLPQKEAEHQRRAQRRNRDCAECVSKMRPVVIEELRKKNYVVIEAPFEADAMMPFVIAKYECTAVISADSDLPSTWNCPYVLSQLNMDETVKTFHANPRTEGSCRMIITSRLQQLLAHYLGFGNQHQLSSMAMAMINTAGGNDYIRGLVRIAFRTALDILKDLLVSNKVKAKQFLNKHFPGIGDLVKAFQDGCTLEAYADERPSPFLFLYARFLFQHSMGYTDEKMQEQDQHHPSFQNAPSSHPVAQDAACSTRKKRDIMLYQNYVEYAWAMHAALHNGIAEHQVFDPAASCRPVPSSSNLTTVAKLAKQKRYCDVFDAQTDTNGNPALRYKYNYTAKIDDEEDGADDDDDDVPAQLHDLDCKARRELASIVEKVLFDHCHDPVHSADEEAALITSIRQNILAEIKKALQHIHGIKIASSQRDLHIFIKTLFSISPPSHNRLHYVQRYGRRLEWMPCYDTPSSRNEQRVFLLFLKETSSETMEAYYTSAKDLKHALDRLHAGKHNATMQTNRQLWSQVKEVRRKEGMTIYDAFSKAPRATRFPKLLWFHDGNAHERRGDLNKTSSFSYELSCSNVPIETMHYFECAFLIFRAFKTEWVKEAFDLKSALSKSDMTPQQQHDERDVALEELKRRFEIKHEKARRIIAQATTRLTSHHDHLQLHHLNKTSAFFYWTPELIKRWQTDFGVKNIGWSFTTSEGVPRKRMDYHVNVREGGVVVCHHVHHLAIDQDTKLATALEKFQKDPYGDDGFTELKSFKEFLTLEVLTVPPEEGGLVDDVEVKEFHKAVAEADFLLLHHSASKSASLPSQHTSSSDAAAAAAASSGGGCVHGHQLNLAATKLAGTRRTRSQ